MARVNVNILGVSELKWTRMGEFNSDDHYIYYCRQESLKRSGVALIVNKSLKYSTWVKSQKQQKDLNLFPRQTINIIVIQVMPQPLMPKKLKLNGSMKTYKTF